MIQCLFLADSRAHHFIKYPKLPDYAFTVDLISIRGANIYNLVGPAKRKLQSYNTADQTIIRLGAEVNDLTAFVNMIVCTKKALTAHSRQFIFRTTQI